MRLAALLWCSLWLGGCSATGDARAWDGRVEVHGALRAMFHEGRTGAEVRLDSLLPNPDLYGVGALSELSGEVTVIGGRAFLCSPAGEFGMRTETSLRPHAAAALFVAASVPSWLSFVTERAIPFEQLDEEIARLASAAGMSSDQRFPFLVEGAFENLEWHVIDGRRLQEGASSHTDHLAAAVHARRDRTRALLVGFYSKKDQGIFTHMGSSTHVHCVVEDPVSAGHVDHVDIPAGTTIRFPERRERAHSSD